MRILFSIIITTLFVLYGLSTNAQTFHNEEEVIVDCNYSFEESISGIDIPKALKKILCC